MTSSYVAAKQASGTRRGVGLGLRWDFLSDVLGAEEHGAERIEVAFWEVSPENYMGRGGYFKAALEQLKQDYEFICHGLTMSVGAVDAPPAKYISDLRDELDRMGSPWHSDHLCLSTAGPLLLHELLPLPHTRSFARRVADRVRSIEDELGRPFLLENISYYSEPFPGEMTELDFICDVLERADCGLLLDVNNVYVNAQNHGYDAGNFIRQLPHDRVVQLHVAGHLKLKNPHPAEGLLLDTHGAPVASSVRSLLASTLQQVGPVPVVLERDNEVPPLQELLDEVKQLQELYDSVWGAT